MREARRNLAYTHLGVATIAYTLSYADPAYFTRAFTRDAGLSPRAFRAQVAASASNRALSDVQQSAQASTTLLELDQRPSS